MNPTLFQCISRVSFHTFISSYTVKMVLRDTNDADRDPLLCDILMSILNEKRNSSG